MPAVPNQGSLAKVLGRPLARLRILPFFVWFFRFHSIVDVVKRRSAIEEGRSGSPKLEVRVHGLVVVRIAKSRNTHLQRIFFVKQWKPELGTAAVLPAAR